MQLFGAALIAASMTLVPLLAAAPARAQGDNVLGQVQRFFDGNNNGSRGDQNAYEQGRIDQQRQQDARHERHRAERADNYDRHPDQRRSYDQSRGYNQGYDQRYNRD